MQTGPEEQEREYKIQRSSRERRRKYTLNELFVNAFRRWYVGHINMAVAYKQSFDQYK